MIGLTNKYLEDLSNKLIKRHFLGVFPSDVTPETKRKNSA